jgi:hypothetical protein
MNVYGDAIGEFIPPLILSGKPLAEQLRASMAQVGAVGPQSVGGIGWPANQRPTPGQDFGFLGAMSISFGPSKMPYQSSEVSGFPPSVSSNDRRSQAVRLSLESAVKVRARCTAAVHIRLGDNRITGSCRRQVRPGRGYLMRAGPCSTLQSAPSDGP